MNPSKSLVSVGVPVFNGEASVGRALETLLAQSHGNIEIVISDNASTDSTEEICRRYARQDSRVRYLRSLSNMGSVPNFNHVLEESRGDYFMWAAADDFWKPAFVEENLESLFIDSTLIGSVSQVGFVKGATEVEEAGGTYPLQGSPEENVREFLRHPEANSRIYSVFRKTVLEKCILKDKYWGWDWIVVVRTLRYGKYNEVGDRLFHRQLTGESRNFHSASKAYNPSRLGTFLPLWKFTRDVLREGHVRKDTALYRKLFYLNAQYALVALEPWFGGAPVNFVRRIFHGSA